MTNIPFPNSNDADALNDYLDDLAAGKQATPDGDVQRAAAAMHALANQSLPIILDRESENHTGGNQMQTANYSPPISNRTRRSTLPARKESRRQSWISIGLVAALLFSVVGYGFWNHPGESDDSNNIAWAPGTATPLEQQSEPLNPETSPWMADFSVDDCTLAIESNYVIASPEAIEAQPQGYGVVGPATDEDANAIASTYRDMRGCRNMGGAFNYWSHARINNAPRVLNDENRQQLTEIEDYFRTVYPQQFMAVGNDLQVDARMQAEWDLRDQYGIIGIPLPMEAKLNPAWGVELSDGRIAFPATIMYSATDPAITANGLPTDRPDSTVTMIFTFEDGSWKYDDSLQLCLVNCDYGVGNPANPDEETWVNSADPAQCEVTPISGDEYRERLATLPKFDDLSYTISGDAAEADATDAVNTAQSLYDCAIEPEQFQMEAHFTDLGLFNYRFMMQNSAPRDARTAPYFRQRDLGARDLLISVGPQQQATVVDGAVETYTPDEYVWEITPKTADAQNVASTYPSESTYDPASALQLEDGRILLVSTGLISLDSRWAITYEGDSSRWFNGWLVMKETADGWLIDEMPFASPNNLVAEESYQWWWEPQYDATPAATPGQ